MTYDHIASALTKNRISQLIKRAPADANSPEKLAKLTGISLDVINQMDAGKLEPTLNMAYKLAAAFGIPVENVFADVQKATLKRGAGALKADDAARQHRAHRVTKNDAQDCRRRCAECRSNTELTLAE